MLFLLPRISPPILSKGVSFTSFRHGLNVTSSEMPQTTLGPLLTFLYKPFHSVYVTWFILTVCFPHSVVISRRTGTLSSVSFPSAPRPRAAPFPQRSPHQAWHTASAQ